MCPLFSLTIKHHLTPAPIPCTIKIYKRKLGPSIVHITTVPIQRCCSQLDWTCVDVNTNEHPAWSKCQHTCMDSTGENADVLKNRCRSWSKFVIKTVQCKTKLKWLYNFFGNFFQYQMSQNFIQQAQMVPLKASLLWRSGGACKVIWSWELCWR